MEINEYKGYLYVRDIFNFKNFFLMPFSFTCLQKQFYKPLFRYYIFMKKYKF